MRINFVAQERLELSRPQWTTQFKCVLPTNSNIGPLFSEANIYLFFEKDMMIRYLLTKKMIQQ